MMITAEEIGNRSAFPAMQRKALLPCGTVLPKDILEKLKVILQTEPGMTIRQIYKVMLAHNRMCPCEIDALGKWAAMLGQLADALLAEDAAKENEACSAATTAKK